MPFSHICIQNRDGVAAPPGAHTHLHGTWNGTREVTYASKAVRTQNPAFHTWSVAPRRSCRSAPHPHSPAGGTLPSQDTVMAPQP